MVELGGGYVGRIAWVDLSKGEVKVKDIEPSWALKYVGGRGWGARIVWENVPPDVDPLSPANVLVVAPGPLTGLLVPGAGKVSFSAISPETGYYGDSNAGGFFGPELKHAGFDALVITGASDRPVYLWVEDGGIEIRDAEPYWGKGSLDAQEMIRQDLGDSSIKVASIGPAGENLVPIACVNCDWRNAGRTGMGAVMGSKNLKAVVAKGNGPLPQVADIEEVKRLIQEYERAVLDPSRDRIRRWGTGYAGYGHRFRRYTHIPRLDNNEPAVLGDRELYSGGIRFHIQRPVIERRGLDIGRRNNLRFYRHLDVLVGFRQLPRYRGSRNRFDRVRRAVFVPPLVGRSADSP